MISFRSRAHSLSYRMTQLIALPLPTDEPRADALLFPEVQGAPALNASGNLLVPSDGTMRHIAVGELADLPSEPVRHSGTVQRCDDPSPSSSRLATGREQWPAAATHNNRLASLVREHSNNVWRALRRLGVPVDFLDDAMQEVFIIASRKLDVIDDGAERSFLYGTALRVAANHRRAQKARRHDPLSDDNASLWQTEPDAEQLVHRKHLRELLDQILDNMPDELREVFVLFELERLTRQELATLLGLPAGTVASRLRRARDLFEDACAKLRAFPEGGPR